MFLVYINFNFLRVLEKSSIVINPRLKNIREKVENLDKKLIFIDYDHHINSYIYFS